MTEKLYWKDQNLSRFDGEVVDIVDGQVKLDRTAFYPRGGGQPSDTGTLKSNGSSYVVEHVEKAGDDVLHRISGDRLPEVGTRVEGEIDWNRRYSHMRYHTAIHVLDGVITQNHGSEGTLTGGQMYEDRARIDFDMEGLTREKVQEIIQEANGIIQSGLKVYAKEISGREALNIPNLSRTLPGKDLIEQLDTVRVVVIEGLDEQADGGTHVSNTSEIGKIVFTKLQSKGRRNKRVEFVLEDHFKG